MQNSYLKNILKRYIIMNSEISLLFSTLSLSLSSEDFHTFKPKKSPIQADFIKIKGQEKFIPCFNCLKGHNITPEIRSRMID